MMTMTDAVRTKRNKVKNETVERDGGRDSSSGSRTEGCPTASMSSRDKKSVDVQTAETTMPHACNADDSERAAAAENRRQFISTGTVCVLQSAPNIIGTNYDDQDANGNLILIRRRATALLAVGFQRCELERVGRLDMEESGHKNPSRKLYPSAVEGSKAEPSEAVVKGEALDPVQGRIDIKKESGGPLPTMTAHWPIGNGPLEDASALSSTVTTKGDKAEDDTVAVDCAAANASPRSRVDRRARAATRVVMMTAPKAKGFHYHGGEIE